MPLLLSGVEVVEIQMGADAVTVERPGRDGGGDGGRRSDAARVP